VSGQQLPLSGFLLNGASWCRWYDANVPRALVLNASLEPLSVVPVRRALVLVLRDRADVLVTNGALWRSEARAMPSPSVVRLKRYVRVSYQRRVPVNRRTVFQRDGYRCQYCGHQAENLDHVVPRSQGGEHSWTNVVAACRRCNTKKGGRTPTQAGITLTSTPRQPRSDTWVAAAIGGSVDPDWVPYVRA
jgi:5-methylcytosine-specific restriction endonuclease McrA